MGVFLSSLLYSFFKSGGKYTYSQQNKKQSTHFFENSISPQTKIAKLRAVPRILRIINRFCMEGPIHNVLILSKGLSEYDTLIVGGEPLPHETTCIPLLEDHSIPFQAIPEMGRTFHPSSDWIAFRKIRQIIQKFKPDIIHSHAFGMDALSVRWAISSLKGILKIHTYHGHIFSDNTHFKMRFLKFLERRIIQKWDIAIAISESQKTELASIYKIISEEKVQVIPLGIEMKKFDIDKESRRIAFRQQHRLHENDIAIGIIARLALVKNHTLFIDVIAELTKTHHPIKAFIIGDGEQRESLLLYAKQKGVFSNDFKSSLIFTSWIDHIEDVLPAMDIIALTSHSEGTPVSLIEAQAMGIPVVATNVGGIKDCMVHQSTGLLVPPSNREAFINALSYYIHHPNKRNEAGINGMEYVQQKFNSERLISDVRALYTRLQNTQQTTPFI